MQAPETGTGNRLRLAASSAAPRGVLDPKQLGEMLVWYTDLDLGESDEEHHYDPLNDHTALFLEFARLPPERDAIAKFCSQYGDPFTPRFHQFYDAVAEIDRMTQAVAALNEVRHGVGKAKEAARHQLEDFVRSDVSSVTFRNDPTWTAEGELCLNLVVETLHDVLWLQFGRAISEGRQFRDCEHCGRPFELAPGESRSDKEFCSDTCRAKHHYHARKKALAMYGKSKSVAQIAKVVGYEEAIVRNWLKRKKGK